MCTDCCAVVTAEMTFKWGGGIAWLDFTMAEVIGIAMTKYISRWQRDVKRRMVCSFRLSPLASRETLTSR